MPSFSSHLAASLVLSHSSFRSLVSPRVLDLLTFLRTSTSTSFNFINYISGTGATIISNVCKALPDRINMTFLSSFASRLVASPLQTLVSFMQTCPLRLLFWFSDSGETAYMVGRTAPSTFDSRVFLVAPFN
jgi:hypothetical protein